MHSPRPNRNDAAPSSRLPPELHTHALAAIEDAGLDPARAVVRPERHALSRWLTQTCRVRSGDLHAVLKIHPWDIAGRIAAEPDPRFHTLANMFPIATLNAPLAPMLEQAAALLPVPVPTVLAEGSVPATTGEPVRYTLLTRIAGRTFEPRAWRTRARKRCLSRELGKLTASLHGGACSPVDAEWGERFAEVMHGIADHVGRCRGARRHHRYHRRLAAVLDHLFRRELGGLALVHGDPHPSNFLFDEAGQVCGVVDFNLATRGPTTLDFRWLALLDEVEFLAAYGSTAPEVDRACWIGHCIDMFWHGLAVVVMDRFTDHAPDAASRIGYLARFDYLLRLCESDRLRRGPPWRRRIAAQLSWLRAGATVARKPCRPQGSRRARESAEANGRVAIVVPAYEHFPTTTGPCLAALRRFTDVSHRVVCVDNGSADETRTRLLERHDPRLEVVLAERNLGWAQGSLLGLRQLRDTDTHVLLLNSDTLVGPRWLRRLLWHLHQEPRPDFVIGNECAVAAEAAKGIEPGTGRAARPPADHAAFLRGVETVERRFLRRSEVAPPSGFCLLFPVERLPLVEEYLRDFHRFHRGELDWYEWWTRKGAVCRRALDVHVFHARGGSGGYYDYARGD